MSKDAPALVTLKRARLIPPLSDRGPFHRSPGVFDQNGAFCDLANIRRDNRFELAPRSQPEVPPVKISGRHLYGGQINHHFGHFLCESISRFWALGATDGIESVLLIPRRSMDQFTFQSFHDQFFGLLNLPVPVRVINEPVEIEELVIPEQGFGTGDLSAGTPAFRDWIRGNLATGIAPDGPERIYLSRHKMGIRSGAVLNEDALVENLTKAGYECFAPEQHDLGVQIARYRAAKKIIGIEGSALHLYGFVGHADQQAAIIARRSDLDASETIARQIRAFCGADTHVLSHLLREWDIHDDPVRSSKSLAELDMTALGRAMADVGLVPDTPWPPAAVNAERYLKRVHHRTGRVYSPVAGVRVAG